MLENKCDLALRAFYERKTDSGQPAYLTAEGIATVVKEMYNTPLSEQEAYEIACILSTEGYVDSGQTTDFLRINAKGVAFLKTDSFADRKSRWDLERKAKLLEYSLKKKTFWIAIIGITISIISLMISIKNNF